MPFTYEYPRPAVTVDVAVFAKRGDDLVVLLIERKHAPFEGSWALPGGFVDENEALEVAAARELKEETGLAGLTLTQVGAFGAPGRDPRGHTVSIAFVTEANLDTARPSAGDDAAKAEWHRWDDLPVGRESGGREPGGREPGGLEPGGLEPGAVRLAFDHDKVLLAARAKLSHRL